MLKPLFFRTASILLCSVLTIAGTACSQKQKTARIPTEQQPSLPSASPMIGSVNSSVPQSIQTSEAAIEPTSFEMALDKAAGGFSVSQSAHSPEDWQLVADYYQDAIDLMKTVKPQARYYPIAKAKVKEYQRHLDYALEKSVAVAQPQKLPEPEKILVAVPPLKESIAHQKMQIPQGIENILQQNLQSPIAAPQQLPPPTTQKAIPIPVETKEVYAAVPIQEDTRQAMVFTSPIKRRIGGTPIIDVTFNGQQQFEMIVDTGASGTVITQQMASLLGVSTIGKAKANTASAQSVEFPIGYVDSIEAGGVKIKKVPVAIAGSELENGLLGHDFFGNYDITIKSNVVEFRPRLDTYPTSHKETRKSIPIYPKKLFNE
ncbi:MAG: retroviral-like aspartic protease family protein [Nostocales cyanobacterium 94392]|nr:retroviral-like aspartic protease family protein [Nostocales cyanobacterium 94392]